MLGCDMFVAYTSIVGTIYTSQHEVEIYLKHFPSDYPMIASLKYSRKGTRFNELNQIKVRKWKSLFKRLRIRTIERIASDRLRFVFEDKDTFISPHLDLVASEEEMNFVCDQLMRWRNITVIGA